MGGPHRELSPVLSFIIAELKRDPAAQYAEVAERAKARNLRIYPVNWGRAKLLLGMVKPGQGETRRRPVERAKRGDLNEALLTLQAHATRTQELQRALEQIRGVLRTVGLCED